MADFIQFAAEIKKSGIAKSSHFVCDVVPPAFMTGNAKMIDLIPLYIRSTNFPEFSLATQPIRDHGLVREAVYDKLYGSGVRMNFICDQDMTIKKFFDDWIQFAVSDRGGRFTYPDRYIADTIRLYHLNTAKDAVYVVVLNKVYPKVVDDIMVSSDSMNTISSFNVVFTYESWDSYQISSEPNSWVTVNPKMGTSNAPKKTNRILQFIQKQFHIPTLEGLQEQLTSIATQRIGGLVKESTFSVDSRINQTINGIIGQTRNRLYNL